MVDMSSVWWSIWLAGFGVLCVVCFVLSVFDKKDRSLFCVIYFGFFVLLFMAAAFLVVPNGAGTTYRERVAPGTYLTSDGSLRHKSIPDEPPIVYEKGDPKRSGYALCWWRWYNVEYVATEPVREAARRDLVVYRTEKEALLGDDSIIDLPREFDEVAVSSSADAFWRHDHPGQKQAEFEMLVRPEKGKARIEKWVFIG